MPPIQKTTETERAAEKAHDAGKAKALDRAPKSLKADTEPAPPPRYVSREPGVHVRNPEAN